MMMNNPLTTLLCLLLTLSTSHAQDSIVRSIPPSSVPTSVPTIGSISPMEMSQSPTLTPTHMIEPTALFTSSPTEEFCENDPRFVFEVLHFSNCNWIEKSLTCDDASVSCDDYGNIGPARYHCCKCKSQCDGQCNDPVYTTVDTGDDQYSDCDFDGWARDDDIVHNGNDFLGLPPLFIVFFALFAIAVCARCVYAHQGQAPARRAVQQTMTARRQQQRENNNQGLTVDERNNTRYEQFVTKFYFQTVLPDKSNITANSLRNSKPDQEHPTNKHHDDEEASEVGSRQNSFLSSWRRPSPKDECCICLECYSEGETICAPMTTECNHVFHEECILEWLKTNDHCPLCRVELLKD